MRHRLRVARERARGELILPRAQRGAPSSVGGLTSCHVVVLGESQWNLESINRCSADKSAPNRAALGTRPSAQNGMRDIITPCVFLHGCVLSLREGGGPKRLTYIMLNGLTEIKQRQLVATQCHVDKFRCSSAAPAKLWATMLLLYRMQPGSMHRLAASLRHSTGLGREVHAYGFIHHIRWAGRQQ